MSVGGVSRKNFLLKHLCNLQSSGDSLSEEWGHKDEKNCSPKTRPRVTILPLTKSLTLGNVSPSSSRNETNLAWGSVWRRAVSWGLSYRLLVKLFCNSFILCWKLEANTTGPATGGPAAPSTGLGFTVSLRKITRLQEVGITTRGQLERECHRGGAWSSHSARVGECLVSNFKFLIFLPCQTLPSDLRVHAGCCESAWQFSPILLPGEDRFAHLRCRWPYLIKGTGIQGVCLIHY